MTQIGKRWKQSVGRAKNFQNSGERDGKLGAAEAFGRFHRSVQRRGILNALLTGLAYLSVRFQNIWKRRSPRRAPARNRDSPHQGWIVTIELFIQSAKEGRTHPLPASAQSQWVQRLQDLAAMRPTLTGQPQVTIILPAYNSFEEVCACIESVLTWPSSIHFEIVIADDASPTTSFFSLAAIDIIRVTRNPVNLGYIKNVNRAAKMANADLLLTLNSDVIVGPGWIDHLVLAIDSNQSAVIVGPKILDDELQLSEAGGVVFSRGEASNRGKGCDRNDSPFDFSCQVDYVSGCAMLVRRSFWETVGGLPEELSPAYFDDVDLCLQAWRSGRQVLYSPNSFVVHLGGTSMGKNPADSNSLKRHMLTNRPRVQSRNKDLLDLHLPFDGEQEEISTFFYSHYQQKREMAVIAMELPRLDSDGGSGLAYWLLRYLIELDFQIRLVCLNPPNRLDSAHLRSIGIECLGIESTRSKEIINRAQHVLTFGIEPGLRYQQMRRTTAIWIHHTVDIHSRRLETLLNVHPRVRREDLVWHADLPDNPAQLWQIESSLLMAADQTIFVTEQDLEFATNRGFDGNFVILPTLHGDKEEILTDRPSPRETIGFVGAMSHVPNIYAVDYFLSEMWPLLREDLSCDARFVVWGSNISDANRLAWQSHEGVEVRGWFADWSELASEMRVMVSPLLTGAGLKTKVVAAIKTGIPVLGTGISFEGLPGNAYSLGLATDSVGVLNSRLVEVLHSESAWHRARAAGQTLLGEGFSRVAERKLVSDIFVSAEKINPSIQRGPE